jgi:sulfide:quinone oxidoreductase
MAHVVVVGAGIGGMPAAYQLRAELDIRHQVTLVSRLDYFQFVPSNPWVAVGWRDRQSITVPLRPHLEAKGIGLVLAAVTRIDPTAKRLELADGQTLDFDFLVLATGPEPAFDEVPGAGPEAGHSQSVCTTNHAERAWAAYRRLLEQPGPLVVAALPGASCFVPAYEFVFMLDADLRKRHRRERYSITFVTCEPHIGHLGLGGVGDSQTLLQQNMARRGIDWVINARVNAVDQGSLKLEQLNPAGDSSETMELPFNYAMLMPAFRGAGMLAGVDGLTDERGFVLVDEYQRSRKYPGIYALGLCAAVPPVDTHTPVPTRAPVTGYMIECMVKAVVQNIGDELAQREISATADCHAVCLMDMGANGVAFAALPQMPPRELDWLRQGRWVHLAKVAFEKYFIRKIKNGTSEQIYDRYVLKMMGISKH